jgi:hypothetical protein
MFFSAMKKSHIARDARNPRGSALAIVIGVSSPYVTISKAK